MTPTNAAKIIGLDMRYSFAEADVRECFARAVRAAHPDAGGSGDIASIKRARDVLLKVCERQASVEDCRKCDGSGRIKTKRGPKIDCHACNGTGTVRKKESRRG